MSTTSDPTQPAGGRTHLLAGVAVLVGGLLSAVQSRGNGTLSVVLGEPLLAALWSFGTGWILLTVGLLAPGVRRGLVAVHRAWRRGEITWWQCLGGLIGGCFVAVQSWSVPIVGVALFMIALVAGQTGSALFVDRVGLGPAGRVPVTRGRVVAALVTLVGVAVAVSGSISGGAAGSGAVVPVLAGIAVGAAFAIQGAVNGRVNAVSGHVMTTTWMNFTWGLVLLLALAAARAAMGGLHGPRSLAAPWWSVFGGVIGIVFIAVSAWAVRHLGVLLLMLLTIAGQITGALALDLIDPAARAHIGPTLLLGVAITFAAAVGAGLAARRRSTSQAPAVAGSDA